MEKTIFIPKDVVKRDFQCSICKIRQEHGMRYINHDKVKNVRNKTLIKLIDEGFDLEEIAVESFIMCLVCWGKEFIKGIDPKKLTKKITVRVFWSLPLWNKIMYKGGKYNGNMEIRNI